MAEDEGDLDPVAVDGAVLGIGDGHRERDGLSPKANSPPSTGMSMLTVGAVLPTVIVVLAAALLPLESVTVSRAVYWPASCR